MNQEFYANMNWWCIEEMPVNDSLIPIEFLKAKNLWLSDCVKNHKSIIELLQPFLKALFLMENLHNSYEIFEDTNLLEIQAHKVILVDVNFEKGSIPTCRSEAYYSLKIKDKFNSIDLSAWQEKNSSFTDAISFYWDLKLHDFDSCFSTHSGVECIPTQI
jgi:hypothetical protein